MSEPKWTPGKWEFLEADYIDEVYDNCLPFTIGGGPNHDDLAIIYSCEDANVSVSRDEAIANAHLIAASPELYEALVYLVSESDDEMDEDYNPHAKPLAQARAALKSARGES